VARDRIPVVDLVLVALLVLAVGGVVVVALGRVGGGLAPVDPGLVPPLDHEVRRPADLDRARFTLALRGYRMDQVDTVLDEARDLLAAKDEEIARLRRLVPVDSPGDLATVAPATEPPVTDHPTPTDPAPSDPAPSDPAPGTPGPAPRPDAP
jgi:DivIVA domain-containing protein